MKRLFYISGLWVALIATGIAQASEEFMDAGRKALLNDRDYPEAIRLFRACLDAGVEGEALEQCLNWLGESYWASNQIDNAIQTFTREVMLGKSLKERPVALLRKAMALMQKGDPSGGMATYALLAKDYPHPPYGPNALIVQANYTLLEEVNLRKAVSLYEQIAGKYPETPEAKTSLEWLPNLRKMSQQELKERVRQVKEKEARIRKVKKQ